jgi:demethoxyubiquinone hydroxylase (CLK1/Coq7/Cat5 family)
VAISANLSKALDKAYENSSLEEILAAPPSALAGLTERHDAALKELLGIDTVGELGANQYFALAGVLVALAGKVG